jgi:hypothetical protein
MESRGLALAPARPLVPAGLVVARDSPAATQSVRELGNLAPAIASIVYLAVISCCSFEKPFYN